MARREQNKQEKEARIRRAAAELFVERGFDATTVAAVAERAAVAKGTVFLYAKTKVDLLALVFEDRILDANRDGLSGLDPGLPLSRAFLAVFARFFAIYEPHPELARVFVRELLFAGGTAKAVRDDMDRALLRGLAAHVEMRQARGEIDKDAPAILIATNAFGLYIVALIAWLSGALPSRAATEQYLALSLELAMSGLGASKAPPAPSRARAVKTKKAIEKGRKR